MITTEKLGVSLGKKQVLRDIGFVARTGEITAIVGPNGSGKSTLLRAISGELPFIGSVFINGLSLLALKPPELAAMRAVLPQATQLAFSFSVREVIQLGLSAGCSGAPDAIKPELVELALERVDLPGFAPRLYHELSGGEQQRVQLARVICQIWEPVYDGSARWLLLDEPVSSLDIRHQLIIMRLAHDYAARGGSVIAVMHDLNLTAMFAQQVHMLNQGRSIAAGTPTSILNDDILADVFECDLRVGAVPDPAVPFVLPHTAM